MAGASGETTVQIIRCGVAGETYAFDMRHVRVILRMDRLRAGPDDGKAVGWVSDNEGDAPVFRLADLLGRGDEDAGAMQRIVVLNSVHGRSGVLVDRVSPVESVPASAFKTLPQSLAAAGARFFEGVLRLDEGMILLADPDRLHPSHDPGEDVPRTRLDPPHAPAPSAAARRGAGRVLLFSACDDSQSPIVFCLSATQVPEIIDRPALIPVPGAPSFVLGLADWRSSPLPVVDLAWRLGLVPAPLVDLARVMIARDTSTGTFVGFPARPSVRMLTLPAPNRPWAGDLPVDRSLILGAVELDGETVVIPDVRRIL